MKALPWIIAGVGVGLTAYFLLNQPGPQYATGNDDIEDAAGKTALWGSKQRVKGTGGGLVGKLKEGVGRATGDGQLEGEGLSATKPWELSETQLVRPLMQSPTRFTSSIAETAKLKSDEKLRTCPPLIAPVIRKEGSRRALDGRA